MVDSINVPMNLTKVMEVRDTSEPLRKFLIEMLTRIQNLEKDKVALTNRVKVLEDAS